MNIIKYAAAAFLLSGFFLTLQGTIPEEEVIFIESELGDYDGEKINLQRNVKIEHILGTISANNITLHISKKKESFGLLQMEDHVILAFKDGGMLSCGQAEVNYNNSTGNFSGNKSDEFVIYTEKSIDRRERKADIPLVVRSCYMSILLDSTKVKGNKHVPKNSVGMLTADEKVSVNYNEDFTIHADHAIYRRTPETADSAKTAVALPGVIEMSAPKNGLCKVTNKEGSVINASQISIDTIQRQLNFNNPNGILRENTSENSKTINFSAKTLAWDDQAGILTLRDQVVVDQQGIGKLTTAKEVRFYHEKVGQKKTIKAIEAEGNTLLTYRETDKNLSHTLACPGLVKVDHEKMETRLLAAPHESLVDEDSDRQVHFEDAKGEIFADKALIKYALMDGSINISKIYLLGNVKIYNRLSSVDDETIVTLQYILADRVDFTPNTNEMIFKSLDQGRRVLFFDKTNNLQVSAPALKIIREKATQKESIKGLGDVRFSFLDSEFEQLCKRFSSSLSPSKKQEDVSENN